MLAYKKIGWTWTTVCCRVCLSWDQEKLTSIELLSSFSKKIGQILHFKLKSCWLIHYDYGAVLKFFFNSQICNFNWHEKGNNQHLQVAGCTPKLCGGNQGDLLVSFQSEVSDKLRFTTFYFYFALVVCELILCCFNEKPPLFSNVDTDPVSHTSCCSVCVCVCAWVCVCTCVCVRWAEWAVLVCTKWHTQPDRSPPWRLLILV